MNDQVMPNDGDLIDLMLDWVTASTLAPALSRGLFSRDANTAATPGDFASVSKGPG